jgi:hypothetical protein
MKWFMSYRRQLLHDCTVNQFGPGLENAAGDLRCRNALNRSVDDCDTASNGWKYWKARGYCSERCQIYEISCDVWDVDDQRMKDARERYEPSVMCKADEDCMLEACGKEIPSEVFYLHHLYLHLDRRLHLYITPITTRSTRCVHFLRLLCFRAETPGYSLVLDSAGAMSFREHHS